MPAEALQVGFEAGDPAGEAPTIDLELGLPGPPGANAACLLAERPARPAKAGQPVAELGQLHLSLTFGAAGVLGENVEDHRGAVQGRALQNGFEVPLLGWGEVIVENDGVGVMILGHRADLIGFSASDVGGPVRLVTLLDHPGHGVSPGSVD